MRSDTAPFWQRRWLRWLNRRLPRSQSTVLNQRRIFILPSRQGMLFLAVTLVIFIGGINYANSLILAIAFMLVSLFIVSKLHTYANLSGLTISAGRAENSFAGEQAFFEIVLSRASGAKRRQYQAITLSWGEESITVDLLDEDQAAFWLALPAAERGVLQPPRLRVETRFPLGLLKAWTLIQLDQQCLVYPEPREGELPSAGLTDDEEGTKTRNSGSDFEGLRVYSAGDNPRHIGWKQYAAGRGLNTKYFVDHLADRVALNWHGMSGLDAEERLSVLCYWVLELSEQGQAFSLELPAVFVPESTGQLHRDQCLKLLALYGQAERGGSDD